jgi:RNA polymerase sigma factor (sigma-70 family)
MISSVLIGQGAKSWKNLDKSGHLLCDGDAPGANGMTPRTFEPTDKELLTRFTTRKDKEAFAELVRRYGPMVFGVCRRLVRSEQDAEDAFQATFVVLARKADSIRQPEALSGWLYGVACRLATRLRRATAKRQAREVPLVTPPVAVSAQEHPSDDIAPVLHEEISQLPEHYRLPVVLCYLHGKTNEEAARVLGCAPGTVFSRLARARERLRDRLKRRGLPISMGLLVAALTALPEQTPAAVPPELLSATVENAVGPPPDPSRTNFVRVQALADSGGRGRSLLWTGAMAALLGTVVLTLLVAARGCNSGGSSAANDAAKAEVDALPAAQRVEAAMRERLQGVWPLKRMNHAGFEFAGLDQVRATFERDRLTVGGPDFTGIYRLDAAKDPIRIDWTLANGAILHGIIEIKADTLAMSFAEKLVQGGVFQPLPDPPADFQPGPDNWLMTASLRKP